MTKETEADNLAAIYASHERISDIIVETPLLESKWLSLENKCNIFLKMESEQITGSFKLRGATNKIKKLYESSKDRLLRESLVTASSGNHALACAYASSKMNVKMTIYSYMKMSPSKEKMLSMYDNVELKKYGDNCCAAEIYARSAANKDDLIYISPYNDIDIIHGQATIGVEMLKQKNDLDFVFVTVGGGGLISGIAMYIKSVNPNIRIIGCQPINDCSMYEYIKADCILEDNVIKDTFSDGSAGRVEPGAITFDLCKQYVDEWLLLDEEEIERAVYDMMVNDNKIIEGAAGLVIAGARKIKERLNGKNVALVICGANIGINNINYLLKKYCVN